MQARTIYCPSYADLLPCLGMLTRLMRSFALPLSTLPSLPLSRQCSWGSKPTHPSVVSTGGLPPPPPTPLLPPSSAANPDLMAYQMTQTQQLQPSLLQHQQHQQQFQSQLPPLHFRDQHLQGGAALASGGHQLASGNGVPGVAAAGPSGVGVNLGGVGLSAGMLVGGAGAASPAMVGAGAHALNGGMGTGMVGRTADVVGMNAHAVGGHAPLPMQTMAAQGMARSAGILPGVSAPTGGVYSGFVQGGSGTQSMSGAVGMYY